MKDDHGGGVSSGYLTPGRRLEKLEAFEEKLCINGCPQHKGIVDWIGAAEKRREDGDKEMKTKIDAMIWLMIGNLLAAVGGLVMVVIMLLRAGAP